MSNVVRLGDDQDPTEYQAEMIDVIERVIGEIRSGRTVAYAIATVTSDQAAVTRWQAKDHFVTTLGAVARLQWEMARGND